MRKPPNFIVVDAREGCSGAAFNLIANIVRNLFVLLRQYFRRKWTAFLCHGTPRNWLDQNCNLPLAR